MPYLILSACAFFVRLSAVSIGADWTEMKQAGHQLWHGDHLPDRQIAAGRQTPEGCNFDKAPTVSAVLRWRSCNTRFGFPPQGNAVPIKVLPDLTGHARIHFTDEENALFNVCPLIEQWLLTIFGGSPANLLPGRFGWKQLPLVVCCGHGRLEENIDLDGSARVPNGQLVGSDAARCGFPVARLVDCPVQSGK